MRSNYLYCARRCQVTFLGFIRRCCAGIISSVPLLRLYRFISAFALLLLLSLMGTAVCYPQLFLFNYSIIHLFLVEKVQRRATRFILKNSSNLPCKDRSVKLKLLQLNYWLQCLDLVFRGFSIYLHGYI